MNKAANVRILAKQENEIYNSGSGISLHSNFVVG